LIRYLILTALLSLTAAPASAQVDLSGTWAVRLYEDYIERGPGASLGDFTGTPLTDEGRANALLYSPGTLSTTERQCLFQSPWVTQYRPLGMRIWSEVDDSGRVVAWVIGGETTRELATRRGSGWTAGRIRRPTPGIPRRDSRRAVGKAIRSSRARRT
jgi:hypothetical protein